MVRYMMKYIFIWYQYKYVFLKVWLNFLTYLNL
jgi:hypothetical protein